jgi:thiamine kinase-like enzyme
MSNNISDALIDTSKTPTVSIAQEYSLLPIFIFGLFHEGERHLLITSHDERRFLNFDLLKQNVEIEVISPNLPKIQICQVVQKIAEQKISENKVYRNILFDIVGWVDEKVLAQYSELLMNGGHFIVLDWRTTIKQSIKQLLGLWTRNRQTLYLPNTLQRKNFALKYHMIVEPDLEKPLELLFFGDSISLNPSLNSSLKNWILKFNVGYYLLPHQHILIYQKVSSNGQAFPTSILESVIDQLSDSQSDKFKVASIKKIIISTTNTLLLKIKNSQKSFFVRCPLTRESLQRQQIQHLAIKRLNEANVVLVPQQVLLNSEYLPVFVETAISGKVYEEDFAVKDTAVARKLFLNAQKGITYVHGQIGQHLVYNEKYHRLLIEKRFKFLQSQFPHTLVSLNKIEQMIYNELNGKKVLVGICHGDFKIGNCLYDKELNLQGIIDWDMSEYPGLSLVDLASLLGRGLRHRNKYTIAKLVTHFQQLKNEFDDIVSQYFKDSETDPIDTQVLLWLYWVDRMYKQIKFGTILHKYWVERNIEPVLGKVE